MTAAFVGLGANLGEPRTQVQQAFGELGAIAHTRLVRVSSLYRSAPVGYAEQPPFVNAVAEIDTDLTPERLLAELQAIEGRHGRRRSFPNAPRTLDLDLLLFGDAIIRSERLEVPHPRMHERAFVLVPLLEIAPHALIPGRGEARALLERCTGEGIERLE
jgi:2-amino-4-hydroxy-6-hydroxymethyldihydropteridine diphosphokinase